MSHLRGKNERLRMANCLLDLKKVRSPLSFLTRVKAILKKDFLISNQRQTSLDRRRQEIPKCLARSDTTTVGKVLHVAQPNAKIPNTYVHFGTYETMTF